MRDAVVCRNCRGLIFDGQLSCSRCGRFLHADRLKVLVDQASRDERDGHAPRALAAWREALELLPATSRQSDQVRARIDALGATPSGTSRTPGPPTRHAEGPPKGMAGAGAGAAAGLTGLALLLWKFKFAAVFIVTKAKFLLLGLTKSSTFFSMFAAIGVYTLAYGWQFAVGLVLSIYVHEMGHVAALMRYGIRASAPLFIPFVGAVIRLQQSFIDPRQDARVGLAGPLWGLGAALVCLGVYQATGWIAWGAIAWIGAQINLFNLMPVWQLDGNRAFHSLTRHQRWMATVALALAWTVAGSNPHAAGGWLFILMLVAAYQSWAGTPAREPDAGALAMYVALVATLTAVTLLPLPLLPRG